MRYYDLKRKTAQIMSKVPMHFAFSYKQLAKILEENSCTEDDLVRIPAGGFILKVKKHLLVEAIDECDRLHNEFLASDEGMLDALEFELANHEFCITRDAGDALEALGLSREDERVKRLLSKAIENYLAGVE